MLYRSSVKKREGRGTHDVRTPQIYQQEKCNIFQLLYLNPPPKKN